MLSPVLSYTFHVQIRLLDKRMFESKARITHLTETEKDLQDALTRTSDRLSKAEKEVVLLSEGGESGTRERDRLEDLSIKLQKQVSPSLSVPLSVFFFLMMMLILSSLYYSLPSSTTGRGSSKEGSIGP